MRGSRRPPWWALLVLAACIAEVAAVVIYVVVRHPTSQQVVVAQPAGTSAAPTTTTSSTPGPPLPPITSTTIPPVTLPVPSPTNPPTTPPTAPPPSTTVAATAPTPTIRVGLAELGLVGTWDHHGFTATINADGSGLASWRIYRWCSQEPAPPCDQMNGSTIIDGGHATFTVRAVPQSSVAVATITSSTDHSTLGAPGTVQVTPVLGRSGPGKEIVFPILRDPNFILCAGGAGVTGDCGA